MTKRQKTLNAQRIQRLYGLHCSGAQISVMDIGKVFRVGEAGIAAGMDDTALAVVIAAYVNQIRSDR